MLISSCDGLTLLVMVWTYPSFFLPNLLRMNKHQWVDIPTGPIYLPVFEPIRSTNKNKCMLAFYTSVTLITSVPTTHRKQVRMQKKVSWFKLDMFTISDWKIQFDLRLTLNGVSHHSSILFLNHPVPRKEGNSMNFYYHLFSWPYSVQRQISAVPITWANCIICLQKIQAEDTECCKRETALP